MNVIEIVIQKYNTRNGEELVVYDFKPSVFKNCGHPIVEWNIFRYTNKVTGKIHKWCKKCRADRSKKSFHRLNPGKSERVKVFNPEVVPFGVEVYELDE